MTKPDKAEVCLVLAGICLPLTYILWLTVGLGFDFMTSDPEWFWRDSLAWRTPFNVVHVPGYPLLIAAIHGMTFQQLPPLLIMWFISITANTIALLLVYTTVERVSGFKSAVLAALAYLVWPFSGVVYVAHAYADALALMLCVLSVYYAISEKPVAASVIIGLTVVTHKGLWIVSLLILICILYRFGLKLKFLVASGTPLAILWLSGTVFHSDPFWLVSKSVQVEAASRSSLPVLDGLLGPLLYGGTTGLAKFLILSGLLLAAAVQLAIIARRQPSLEKWISIAILVSCIFLFVSLNQNTIWAAVRFSKLSALPLGWFICPWLIESRMARWKVVGLGSALLSLLLSQFLFGWYTANVFFG